MPVDSPHPSPNPKLFPVPIRAAIPIPSSDQTSCHWRVIYDNVQDVSAVALAVAVAASLVASSDAVAAAAAQRGLC